MDLMQSLQTSVPAMLVVVSILPSVTGCAFKAVCRLCACRHVRRLTELCADSVLCWHVVTLIPVCSRRLYIYTTSSY